MRFTPAHHQGRPVRRRRNERSDAEMKEDKHQTLDFSETASAFELNRRQFLKRLGGGIIIFFSVGDSSVLQARRSDEKERPDFNAYLRIATDGRVTCFTGKIE